MYDLDELDRSIRKTPVWDQVGGGRVKRFLILSARLLMNINYYIHVLRGIEESLTDYDIELVQFSITISALT